mgnify:FL=1
MADAAAYEAEDSRRKERLDLHNQAEVLAYKVDEALSKCKKELDKEEKNRIKPMWRISAAACGRINPKR